MNLQEILKQFRNIQPDSAYSSTSKRALLALQPEGGVSVRQTWSARRTIFRIFETTVAVALTGFFIVFITGGLYGSSFAPVQYAAIDPQSLRAEAQAIDIQVQLANLKYEESSIATAAVPTGKGSATVKTITPKITSLSSGTSAAGGTGTSTATSTVITIDQALQGLSE